MRKFLEPLRGRSAQDAAVLFRSEAQINPNDRHLASVTDGAFPVARSADRVTLTLRIVAGSLLPIVVGAVGLLIAHHPMILTNLALIQTDLGDSRLINYILEHSYLWFCQAPDHREFWSPPFFYPAQNVGAYSDVLLTVAPLYWILRAVGIPYDSAFQGWLIAVSALNFGSAWFLFRRGFRFPLASATAGAFLVAFGAPRINQLGHQQLVPVFFCIMTLFALTQLFTEPGPSRSIRWVWWQVAALGSVLQLYAGFYNGWFLILSLGFCAAWMLALPTTRGPFLRTLWGDAPAIAAAGAVGAIALGPFWTHYLAAARELGSRDYRYVRYSILQPWSWLNVGPDHWLWGRSAEWTLFQTLPMSGEQRVGLGVVTPVVCVLGWYLGRDRILVRIAALLALTLMLISIYLPGSGIANFGMVLVMIVAARFFHDRRQLVPGLVVLGSLLVLATFERFPSWRVIGLTLFTITLGLVEVARLRDQPARLVLPSVLILWLCYWLFDLTVMGLGLAFVVPVVAIIERFDPTHRAGIRVAGLGVWVLGLILITYPDQPAILGFVGAVPVALWAARLSHWSRSPERPMAIAVIVSLWVIVLLENQDSLWYHIYTFVPGAQAIRAVGRSGLAVLIAAAIGFAAFYARPWVIRRPWLAGLLGAFCMAEQGITTPTYDKFVERDRIAALTSCVDRSAAAFYYRRAESMAFQCHLDAMWMSMASGVPTVNGYSGGSPRAWDPLLFLDWKRGKQNPTPREALDAWLRVNHLSPERIQAIGIE